MSTTQLERTGTTEIRRITEEAQEIAANLAAVLHECKSHAEMSIRLAWRLGDKCLEAKSLVGFGNFALWLEMAGIKPRSAQRYMSLRTKYDSIDAFLETNAQRDGYLALIVPEKEHPELEGDAKLNPPKDEADVFVNKLHNLQKKAADNMTPEQIQEKLRWLFDWLLPHFRPVLDVGVETVKLN